MPSDMHWYIPERVVYVRETGVLHLKEVRASNEKARGYLGRSPHPIHFLIDHTKLEEAPKSLSALVSNLDTFRHPNMGWLVVFGHDNNRFFRALGRFITQFFGVNMREVDTLDQALMFLIELDDTLEPLILEIIQLQMRSQRHRS
jgi:hypothetical protein